MVIGGTQVVLDSSHVRVTYGTNQRKWGFWRTCPKYPNWPITAKRVIFKEKQKSWCIFLKFMWSSLSLIGFIRFKGTLTCEEYRTHWVSLITMKKVCQDCRLLWKSPFLAFWADFGLFWTFLTAPNKSFLSLIGFISYPAMWGVQNNLSLSQNPLKSVSRLPSPLKITLYTFLALFWLFFDIPDSSF